MANKYRKKPVVIEAIQVTVKNFQEVCRFVDAGQLKDGKPEKYIDGRNRLGFRIPTLEGLMTAKEGDWIIRGIKEELYPCKPDIFEATYEKVVEGPEAPTP